MLRAGMLKSRRHARQQTPERYLKPVYYEQQAGSYETDFYPWIWPRCVRASAVFRYRGHCKKVTAVYGRIERTANLRLRRCLHTAKRLVERGLADLQRAGCLAHRQP